MLSLCSKKAFVESVNACYSMAISKPARTFQDLLVWQKAHKFVLEVYALTAAFPR
jgi:hypothetical protein